VLEGDKLYGRGGADDGYAIFGSLAAIMALQQQGIAHARCVVMIEACEESGSYDLPAYIDHLAPRIGDLSLVVCLDSGCANYDQLWSTTSLRGLVIGRLEVSLLSEGVHSGDGTGVVAASERVIRALLDRLDDSHTGQMKLPALSTQIPRARVLQAEKTAEVIGDEVWDKFPLQPGVKATTPATINPGSTTRESTGAVSPLYANLDFAKKSGWSRFIAAYVAAVQRRPRG